MGTLALRGVQEGFLGENDCVGTHGRGDGLARGNDGGWGAGAYWDKCPGLTAESRAPNTGSTQ